jgi:hypothetical protein
VRQFPHKHFGAGEANTCPPKLPAKAEARYGSEYLHVSPERENVESLRRGCGNTSINLKKKP